LGPISFPGRWLRCSDLGVPHRADGYHGGMTHDRPRYGEYATPEEQRVLRGLEPVDTPAQSAVPAQSPPPAQHSYPAPPSPANTAAPLAGPETAAAPRRPRRADRIATYALLAYGLINVIMTSLSYLDLPRVMNQTMQILGIEGQFTNLAQGRLWGTIAAIVLVVGWVATAALSVRRLRTGKLTWWVPLVGAVVTTLVAAFCITVPMLGDPAFTSFVGGGTLP
jgi:uncharacterized membrane protein YhaH (DUF805 family)